MLFCLRRIQEPSNQMLLQVNLSGKEIDTWSIVQFYGLALFSHDVLVRKLTRLILQSYKFSIEYFRSELTCNRWSLTSLNNICSIAPIDSRILLPQRWYLKTIIMLLWERSGHTAWGTASLNNRCWPIHKVLVKGGVIIGWYETSTVIQLCLYCCRWMTDEDQLEVQKFSKRES